MISDTHLHLKQLIAISPEQADFMKENDFEGICSCRTLQEVEFVRDFIVKNPWALSKLKISFGIHPQAPDEKGLKILEKLILENRIAAVGEIGLDRFSVVFAAQLETAGDAGLPVILHIRKAISEVFGEIRRLKKIKKVIFHSYSGTAEEAASILNHGINAYFSFGNAVLNGHKKAFETIKILPEDRILTETDAPYQPKKGETFSKPADILQIRAKIEEIRSVDVSRETF